MLKRYVDLFKEEESDLFDGRISTTDGEISEIGQKNLDTYEVQLKVDEEVTTFENG